MELLLSELFGVMFQSYLAYCRRSDATRARH